MYCRVRYIDVIYMQTSAYPISTTDSKQNNKYIDSGNSKGQFVRDELLYIRFG